MNKTFFTIIGIVSLSLIYQSCQKDEPLSSGYSAVEYSTTPQLPPNPYFYSGVSNTWAALGRVLFYDKALSYNNATACASCHHQSLAFADDGKGSHGFINEKTSRNSPAIFNMKSSTDFFWDMRRNSLDEMVLDPITHTVEMGFSDIESVLKKLRGIDYYKPLFANCIGSGAEFKEAHLAMALKSFVLAIESNGSKFDNQVVGSFTQEELRGQTVFNESGCNNCHGGSNFNNSFKFSGGGGGGGWGGGGGGAVGSIGNDFANIGLEVSYIDKGISEDILATRFNSKGETAKGEGHFKIPSLRNIALTAPYMHDGRFNTLEEVINHYSEGVKNHPGLDSRLHEFTVDQAGNVVDLGIKRLNLSAKDKAALVSFLKTLTDYKLLGDERYSDPFLVRR